MHFELSKKKEPRGVADGSSAGYHLQTGTWFGYQQRLLILFSNKLKDSNCSGCEEEIKRENEGEK